MIKTLKTQKKFDKILSILYDKNLLHWNSILATDLIGFAQQKFNIQWTDVEINYIVNLLQDSGYISMKTENKSGLTFSYISLTPKGIQVKEGGGFVWLKIKSWLTNLAVVWAAIFTITVSIKQIVDIYANKNNKPNNSHTNDTLHNIRIEPMTILIKQGTKPFVSDTIHFSSKP